MTERDSMSKDAEALEIEIENLKGDAEKLVFARLASMTPTHVYDCMKQIRAARTMDEILSIIEHIKKFEEPSSSYDYS